MKITRKVKLTIAIVWVFAIITMLIGTIYIGQCYMNGVYGDDTSIATLYSIKDPVREIYGAVSEYRSKLVDELEEKPARITDNDYLEEINSCLREMNSSIVVIRNGEFKYIGLEEFTGDLQEQLIKTYNEDYQNTKHTDSNNINVGNPYIQGNLYIKEFIITTPKPYICNQITCLNSKDRVSLFMLTCYGNYLQQFRQTITRYSILLVVLMLLLSGVLAFMVYKHFVNPLVKLKKAAEEIGAGNLSGKLDYDEDRQDEIGELFRSFDDMKNKLSESVNEKMRYEEENRELISNISHDLKTPITTIKGYVEGIMDGVADTPEKRERYLKMIYNKANELDSLINELSLYTNINNNAIPYEFHRVSVKDYFSDCMEEIQATLMSHDMTLIYRNYCADDVRVVVDPDQLKRVINNIVTNAIKYCGRDKAQIEIYIHENDDMVKVSISDNGKGIDEESLPHIFDRTYRADSARQSRGGSGLGLAICKKIIEEHGGRIWAKSQKDKGTTILFTLKKYIKEEVTNE
ncbi:MAG: sensor histidine kinase [Coprococcus sp.]